MKTLYRVDFKGQLKGSKALNTTELRKHLVFEGERTYEQIVEELEKTHQYITVLRITDSSKAAICNEVKPSQINN